MNNIGALYKSMERWEDCAKILEEALEVRIIEPINDLRSVFVSQFRFVIHYFNRNKQTRNKLKEKINLKKISPSL